MRKRTTTRQLQPSAMAFACAAIAIVLTVTLCTTGNHNHQHVATTVEAFSATTRTSTSPSLTISRSIYNTNHHNRISSATFTSSSPLFSSSILEDPATTSSSTTTTPTTTTTKSYLDDGFVFGLDGSGLDRPTGKQSQIVVQGDSLETTNLQRFIVWTTLVGNASVAVHALLQMINVASGLGLVLTIVQATLMAIGSWILADFGSGVLHWSVDNYGNGRTPIMGSIIAAFQGHHSAPWTITERGFANNVHKLCLPFGLPTVLLISWLCNPSMTWFMTIFCTFEILSQEFHKWSHTTKSQVPQWVNKLQSAGLTIDRTQHSQHHIAPYEGNYCIISGICNPYLDKWGIFRRLEHLVYRWNGVESNAWKLDPQLKQRTLQGQYGLPTTDEA